MRRECRIIYRRPILPGSGHRPPRSDLRHGGELCLLRAEGAGTQEGHIVAGDAQITVLVLKTCFSLLATC